MEMKFKELPKIWRWIIVVMVTLIILLVSVFVVFQVFLTNMRADNAAKREAVQKPDSELIGTRFELSRDGKASVEMNLYFPKNSDGDKLPVIFNLHGGGFVLGDADVVLCQ